MKTYKPDDIDKKIIALLKENSRSQWREIGEAIHITGQAVGDRVRRLVKEGIITGFHISVDQESLGIIRTDFVTVIMTSGDHAKFLKFVSASPYITEVYRVSGNGCYMIKVETQSQSQFNSILEGLLEFSNYSVNSVVKQMK